MPYLRTCPGDADKDSLTSFVTWMRSITLEGIINAHKLPDIYKSVGCQDRFGLMGQHAIGCTTVVLRQSDSTVVGGRTVDWPAFLKGGEHILKRVHTTKEGVEIHSQTFPGIIHALTASNSHGLVAIVNELGTTAGKGIPYGHLGILLKIKEM